MLADAFASLATVRRTDLHPHVHGAGDEVVTRLRIARHQIERVPRSVVVGIVEPGRAGRSVADGPEAARRLADLDGEGAKECGVQEPVGQLGRSP
jgi:hypothetical protein